MYWRAEGPLLAYPQGGLPLHGRVSSCHTSRCDTARRDLTAENVALKAQLQRLREAIAQHLAAQAASLQCAQVQSLPAEPPALLACMVAIPAQRARMRHACTGPHCRAATACDTC